MTDPQRRLTYVDTGSRGCASQLFSRYRSFLSPRMRHAAFRIGPERTAVVLLTMRASGADYGFAPKTQNEGLRQGRQTAAYPGAVVADEI